MITLLLNACVSIACRIVVHVCCIDYLVEEMGLTCKPTFRNARQRLKEVMMYVQGQSVSNINIYLHTHEHEHEHKHTQKAKSLTAGHANPVKHWGA